MKARLLVVVGVTSRRYSRNIPVEPQDIYIISRTEYTLDNNAPGVVILLSAWQSGTPNDVEVPGVNIYITGGPTDRVARTDGYGYIFVKWPFSESDKDKSWVLISHQILIILTRREVHIQPLVHMSQKINLHLQDYRLS